MNESCVNNDQLEEKINTARHREGLPLVSLCMIARDNEDTIYDALASARPWVDEIVVIDTGSTDRTPEIASEFGARLERFEWCDDFASARNKSLDYASAQWLFWMDTDDILPEGSGRQLREALQQGYPDDVMGLIMQVHCPSNQDPGSQGRLSNVDAEDYTDAAGKQASTHDSAMTVVDHVKVFRNNPNLRFEGRIHEQILPAIRRAGGRVVWTDCHVIHAGADHSPEGTRRKLERDLRILRQDIQERPKHPFVMFNLGMTLLHQNDYEEAKTYLEACVNQSDTDESHLRKAYALLIEALERLGLPHEAKRVAWEGCGRYPDDIEIPFKLGRLLMRERNWQHAINTFQKVLKAGDNRYFASFDPAIRGRKTLANLAVCHEELGQHKEAVGALHACLRDVPDDQDAWAAIIRICKQFRWAEPLADFSVEFGTDARAAGFARLCRAQWFGMRGNVVEANRDYEYALSNLGDNCIALNEYGEFLFNTEQWETSIGILNRLRSLEPQNPSHVYNLGVGFKHLGDLEQANVQLRRALRMRPGHKPTEALLRECARSQEGAKPKTEHTPTPDAANHDENPLLRIAKFGREIDPADPNLHPVLSVCVSIKNRSKILYDDQELRLFPNCVRSLNAAAAHLGPIELVVADFQSTDWPITEWIEKAGPLLSIQVLELGGPFSRGLGLNRAAQNASCANLLLLDADMLVSEQLLADGLHAIESGKASFPIPIHLDRTGAHEQLELAGFGNAFIHRDVFDRAGGVDPFKSWGGEDDLFFEKIRKLSPTVREPAVHFLHQWHPNTSRFLHYARPLRSDYFEHFGATEDDAPTPDHAGRAEHQQPATPAAGDNRRVIKTQFHGFCSEFNLREFCACFPELLTDYQFVLSDEPELVWTSVLTKDLLQARNRWENATHVFLTHENTKPPLHFFDRCISFHRDIDDPRHLRWPLYIPHLNRVGLGMASLLRDDTDANAEPKTLSALERRRFCAFIASNQSASVRNRFVQMLSRHRHVDCPGRALNNMPGHEIGAPGDTKRKIAFLQQYRFAVCFENTSTRGNEGYVTEKLVDAMAAGCIPLYWGDHRVAEDFNTNSFIDLTRYGDDTEAMSEHVMQVDQDSQKLSKLINEPWLHQDQMMPYQGSILRSFITQALSTDSVRV
ncbi:MAG: glycosyltransferase [Phycisphaeraceae bacterium]